ncbi:amino acid adenylation domain-containing protein [Streptomyces sp. MAR4 CNX-425]|uniref:amino acid adenylation domain-containing protein n=1 Tax=Streptomyces sp. MAR4 CNX-425 TaxID=3406343 RepID=UPI003B511BD5
MAFPDGLIKAETLVHLARARAAQQPEQLAYVFLASDGSEETRWTYAQLDARARDIAATLRGTAEPGDRALILQPPGLEYVAAFLGCLYAGLIAVPAYPPRATRKLGRLQAIIDDARPSVALVNEAIAKNTARYLGDEAAQEGPYWLNTDAIGTSDEEWIPPRSTGSDIAFLQYTSGTTATPKGVMVSHANILHNSHVLHRRLDHTPDSCSVSWLPPYHDMGLIGGVLQPLYGGFPGVLMAPATFARDPYQWLRAISTYGGTTSYAPNFAYDLCVEKVTEQQRRTLDLGTWRTACNGAEPVRPSTLASFAAAFADAGFDPESMAPGYGLAEATLVVSGGERSTVAASFSAAGLERGEVLPAAEPSGADARTLVSAGRSVDPGQQIRIVDPETHTECPDDRIGEIWVSADSVAQGYWQRPEQTEETFRARLAGGSDPFMRTGDLGFQHDGRLYITGRSKDLIIVRGRNLYPQDLELCVERSHPSMRTNGSAAVALEADGEEQLLIVAEVARESHDPDIDAITAAVTRAIASEFDVAVHTLVLIRSGTLPKTSSGKIQRHACLRGHLDGELHVLGQWSGSDRPGTGTAGAADAPAAAPGRAEQAVQDYLRAATARQIRIPAAKVVPDDRLLDIGLDSLATFNLLARIADELGASLPATVLMDNPSIAELARAIVLQRGDALPVGPDGLLRTAGDGTSSLPVLVDAPDERFEPFPVTDQQQAYLMGRTDSFEMGNVSTHAYLEFEGADLDLERFTLAWRRMIDRHEMLRAVMDPVRNEQRILREVPLFSPTVVDLRDASRADAEAGLVAVRERLSHEVRPADVWPLFEVVVSLLDGDRVRVHLSVDALISDFASGRILFRELSQFYADPEAQLPPLEMSFRDYVLAETAIEDTELWETSRAYWWNRLDDLPPAPDLPMAKDPSTVAHPTFVRHQSKLDAASWSRLKTRAARAGLTPTGLLLAAYAETLTRWSRTAHFTLNVPRVNRLPLHPQVNEVMGEFASFTLLEVDNRAREPFEVRARRLQEQLWNDLGHQYVSGVRVLRELMRRQGGVDRALMPVVLTSTLALSQDERTTLEHTLTPVHAISQTPQVWLDYQAEEREGELLFNWDAVDELFPDHLIADMFTAHHDLLQRLAEDGGEWKAVDAQPVPERQKQLLDHGIGRHRDVSDALVQDLFLSQVDRRADQPAVVTTGRTLTYGELRHAASQVAWWLRGKGARPGELVAIVMDKGWEQVVAAYGVLLSGAAYLPVDASTPPERMSGLLRQGEVSLVLTQSHLDTLPWPESAARLYVDEPLPGDGSTAPDAVQGPDDLAYALFTSGSTGRPKGVMIAHRGLVNALDETIREFGITADDRALGLTALHHDMSLFDVFGVLGAGGTLVLPDADKTRDAAHWAGLIAAHDITLWNSVPAMMEMLLEHTGTDPVTSLRTVFLGGDWIPLSVPERLAAAAPDAELVSVGGPTETTLWNIWHRVGDLGPDWTSIPYGRPIANTRYYVLNDRLEQCPAWVTGEMYVSGVGLAQGYWRDEERTAAAFLTHPLTGERLYRTGDLGRWRPEGVLEFMGRADFQVKIRGMRIELGEIEAQLAAHPDVNAAVVTPVSHPDRPGYHALTAYITTGAQHTAQLAAAREGDFTDTRIRRVTLQDPLERAEFKLSQPGIRRDPERPRVPLPVPERDDALVERYLRRRSDRNFLDGPVGLQEFSDCLNCLYQIELDGLPKYRYPSGGGLYPVQTYVYVAPGGVADVPPGTYYYQPREGALVLLDGNATMDRGVHAAHNHALFDAAAFSLFFVGETAAVEPMYGEIARDLCMIEAGYMGQLLMTWAAEHEVGLCPVGDMDFPRIGELFGLGDSHVFLHGMVGGRVDRAATRHVAVDAAAQESAVPQPDEMREWLRERLPEHMIPASVVHLDALPLTANGKVDRRNLPAPDLSDATGGGGGRADEARTPTESRLAEIWTDLLELSRVGIHDNFFELGGQSLVATKLVARIRAVFQVEIALRDVFEARTVAELALIIDRHRVGQSEYDLLPAPLPALVDAPDERFEPFPVTDTQQAYLLGRTDVFELGNVSTHAYVEFEGTDLDLERFTLAWRRMIDRHEMLRAVMDPAGNRQRILSDVPPYEPTLVDLRGVDAAAAEARVLEVRERLSHEVRPADVWPLFEVVVSLLDGDRVRVHLSVDALISDFASGRILFRELSQFYADPEAQLPPLEMSFRDYVLAETAIEGTELWETSRAYWWNRLDDLPPAPALPMAKDPSTVEFPTFVRHQSRLDAPSWSRLKTRAARAGLTPTGLLLAAYAEALTCWSNSAHFTLNVPRVNRLPLHPQVNEVMGEFASFTLLEVDNRAREPFEVRARRLQEQLWNDLGHQYVSGVRVLRELMRRQGGVDRALMPVVLTSTLALSQDERTTLEHTLTPVHAISQTPQVWLDYQAEEREGELLFNWDAVDELFPDHLIADMFTAHHDLLQRLADSDDLWSATDLDLLPAAEAERRVLSAGTEEPVHATLVQDLFLGQARRRADQPAVVTTRRTLTYGELHRAANQVAWWLRERGARPGRLVAIVMDKGWEQIAAAYGVLLSGAAYQPIDPATPADRLDSLLRRGEVELVLTQSHLEALFTRPEETTCLYVDRPLPGDGSTAPETVQGPDDLAYTLFTSGSTGLPKGVMIAHRGLVNALEATIREFGITEDDRALGLTALHHDMSLFDVFGVLGAGGTLVLPDADKTRDAAHWADLVGTHRVTLWNSVPAMMEMLLEHTGAGTVGSLRTVFLGGDWIPLSVPERLAAAAPDAELVSVGGPTETTLWNIWYRVRDVSPDWTSIPYGWPIPNTTYHILNERLEPCPEWVTGEMHVAGVGVTQGYWNDPERTEAAFLTHPRTGERLYRTGDLGRWRPDGTIEFVGRKDHQVKIRGMRIELGEIEAQLAAHPDVNAAVVVPDPHPDRPGYHSLTAYVTTGATTPPGAAELREHLAQWLPQHMLPGTFVPLDTLPLTANGKVDRRALAALDTAPARPAGESVAPRTPLEETLAATWAEVLQVDRVGVHDDFFALGGDSLLATKVIARLKAALGGEALSLRVLFSTPNVAAMAEHIEATQAAGLQRPTFGSVHGEDSTEVRAADLTLDRFLDEQTLAGAGTLASPAGTPRTVLLTGANGYIGRFLCLEWLQRLAASGGRLICLVRGSDAAAARKRLDAAFGTADAELLRTYETLAAGHLEVVAGDIAEPRLGLDEPTWARLAADVDAVVHSGALVNHVLPYQHLFEANVLGTAEVVRLALTGRIKPVTYVSSAVVATSRPGEPAVGEDADVRSALPVQAADGGYGVGYTTSKWAGEVLLREAHDLCGLPVTTFRSSMVLAHRRYGGQLNASDMFTRLIFSLIATGVAPRTFYPAAQRADGPRPHYDGLPVDFAAEAVVALSAHMTAGYRTFGLVNPHDDGVSLDTFVDWLVDEGHPIERVDDYHEWLDRFEAAMRALPEAQQRYSAQPLLHVLRYPEAAMAAPRVPSDRFRTAVQAEGIGADKDVPHLTKSLIRKYATDLARLPEA